MVDREREATSIRPAYLFKSRSEESEQAHIRQARSKQSERRTGSTSARSTGSIRRFSHAHHAQTQLAQVETAAISLDKRQHAQRTVLTCLLQHQLDLRKDISVQFERAVV